MLNKLVCMALALVSVNASKIQVIHPTDLKNQFHTFVNGFSETGTIKSALGNFGNFNYGT